MNQFLLSFGLSLFAPYSMADAPLCKNRTQIMLSDVKGGKSVEVRVVPISELEGKLFTKDSSDADSVLPANDNAGKTIKYAILVGDTLMIPQSSNSCDFKIYRKSLEKSKKAADQINDRYERVGWDKQLGFEPLNSVRKEIVTSKNEDKNFANISSSSGGLNFCKGPNHSLTFIPSNAGEGNTDYFTYTLILTAEEIEIQRNKQFGAKAKTPATKSPVIFKIAADQIKLAKNLCELQSVRDPQDQKSNNAQRTPAQPEPTVQKFAE